MKNVNSLYEIEKANAKTYMKNGQIAAYLTSLIAMNNYKRVMLATVAN